MPVPSVRTICPETVRNFGRAGDTVEVPPLTEIQTHSYNRFLQLDVPPEKRTPTGLEGVLREIFPIESYDKSISLQLSTEVSELTNTGAFTLGGGNLVNSSGQVIQVQAQTIPALEVRRAQSTIELPSGGSFAIAGLMQHTTKQVLDAFPGLKDMPVLGALFRSRDFENDETELVIIVSAYLVEPTTAKKLVSPTDGYATPTDGGTIAFGRLNRISNNDPHGLKSAGTGKVGFIVE